MNIFEIANKYKSYLIEKRRFFHLYPEVSFKEYHTSAAIKKELDDMGIPWVSCGYDTGILATITGEKPGKTILLRSDMDALAIQEETGLDYASQSQGVMHACGHDCHMAMLLTAAHILMDMRSELHGTVKLAFQPSEELAKGALKMIEEGALDNVDGCFGIHVWSDIPRGRVYCCDGTAMASCGRFSIDIQGSGGHGSSPQLCIDPIVAASAVVMNMQSIVSREISPMDSACVSIGKITGGIRFNCIADNVCLEGTTRAFSREVSNGFKKRIERIVENTANTFRTSALIKYEQVTDTTVNNPVMAEVVRNAARIVISEDSPIEMPPISASEDFCYFLEKVPGAIALLGVRNPECGAVWPQHSNKYRVDEDVLLSGALLHAKVALDFTSGQVEFKEAQNNFR
jgi:amidohydrolase